MNNNESDPELITKSAEIIKSIPPEKWAYIMSLFPTWESHSEVHDRFEKSFAASLKGDPEMVKACEADREAVKRNIAVFHGVAKAVAIKDPSILETLGAGQTTVRTSSAPVLTDPRDLKVFFDPEGHLLVSVSSVARAKGYQVWVCDGDPNVEANWRLAASSSSCRKIEVQGLNRTKANWFKVRAVRGNMTGPWSNCVSLPPS